MNPASRSSLNAILEWGPGWTGSWAPWTAPAGGGGPGNFTNASSPNTGGTGGHLGSSFIILPNPDPVGGLLDAVIALNRRGLSRIPVPPHYYTKAAEYGQFAPGDGAIITAALRRSPEFYSGGWILDLQPGAVAMTLDTSVFVRSNALSIGTWIHELVHVHQYASGKGAFLASYFGASALTVLKRILNRQPLNLMHSSPHEDAAYELEARFGNWYSTHP